MSKGHPTPIEQIEKDHIVLGYGDAWYRVVRVEHQGNTWVSLDAKALDGGHLATIDGAVGTKRWVKSNP